MRPLFFEEPNNPALTTVAGTYFWGNNFLITPIIKAGVTSTEIYFPKSSNWFDFYTNEKHNAGTTDTVKVNEDYIPTFVRGGSFIPMIETIQNTSSYSLDNFNLHYYFDESVAHSNGMLYNDDGVTPNAFEKEQYEAVHFSSNTSAKSLIIKIATVSGRNYSSKKKNVSVIIHNISNKAKRIFVNGQEQVYKRFSEPLQVNVNAEIGPHSEIKIEY
jgi:oligosaccharide 4-alpha-D-glucosyltransferase